MDILQSCHFVAQRSRDVMIKKDKLGSYCFDFHLQGMKHWSQESPFNLGKLEGDSMLNFHLVASSLAFCFWGDPKWYVEYNGQKYDGWFGLLAALGSAIENETPITDAKFLAGMKAGDLDKILQKDAKIPLFKERVQILREVGTVLKGKFGGKFSNLIEGSGGDAVSMLEAVISNFPSFQDKSRYLKQDVLFYKKAQLLVADTPVLVRLAGGRMSMRNIDLLTASADYKLPMVLRSLGILEYSPRLAKKVDNMEDIKKDSDLEVEIRANTVYAIHLMADEIRKRLDVTERNINDHLWLLGQKKYPGEKPYHRTRTTAY